MIYPNGDSFDGIFVYDIIVSGTLTLNDGAVIHSTYSNNIPFGYGKIVYTDKSAYVGEIKGRFANGVGKMIYPDGKTKCGKWENSVFVDEEFVSPQCGLCKNYLDPVELKVACGRCFNTMCFDCRSKHYAEIKKGETFSIDKICCPFCHKVHFSYGLENEETGIYGKCQKCMKYQKVDDSEKECDTIGFTCKKCFVSPETKK